MRYFLDIESNGFQGQLISIALAPAPEGDHANAFYAAIHCDVPTIWVQDHVLPVLQIKPRHTRRSHRAARRILERRRSTPSWSRTGPRTFRTSHC